MGSSACQHGAKVQRVQALRTIRIEGIAFHRREANNSGALAITDVKDLLARYTASLTTARCILSLTRCVDVTVQGSACTSTFVAGVSGQNYGVDLRNSTPRTLDANSILRNLRRHAILQTGARLQGREGNPVRDSQPLP